MGTELRAIDSGPNNARCARRAPGYTASRFAGPRAVYPGGESSTECIISAHECTSNRALFVLYNFPLLLSCSQKPMNN